LHSRSLAASLRIEPEYMLNNAELTRLQLRGYVREGAVPGEMIVEMDVIDEDDSMESIRDRLDPEEDDDEVEGDDDLSTPTKLNFGHGRTLSEMDDSDTVVDMPASPPPSRSGAIARNVKSSVDRSTGGRRSRLPVTSNVGRHHELELDDREMFRVGTPTSTEFHSRELEKAGYFV